MPKTPENKQTPAPSPSPHGAGGFGGPRPQAAKDEKRRKAEEAGKAQSTSVEEQGE